MDREILFRGKRIDTGEWVEGDICRSAQQIYIHPNHNSFRVTKAGLSKLLVMHDINPDTVGQYTGLTDKNGKKIFEGDIVVWTSKVTRLIGNYTYCFDGYHEGDVLKVVCNEAGFMLARLDDSIPDVPNGSSKIDNYAFWNFHRLLEIIGNIHDNPELMEGE